MKFDYVIGNPPYQEEVENNGRQSPVYHKFIDESYKIGDIVELITPARFLFRAGQTPKSWNEKMLNDEHIKVLLYEEDATKIFPNTEIKAGVAITIKNPNKNYGIIGVFTKYPKLNSIIKRVQNANTSGKWFDELVTSQGLYKFTQVAFEEFPSILDSSGAGTGNKITSKVVEGNPSVFHSNSNVDPSEVKILARVNGARSYKFINKMYIQENDYLNVYNVGFPEATGVGDFGEVIATPFVLKPGEGTADTFLSIGMLDSEYEAISIIKYIKTKFLRTLLGVLKATHHASSSVWKLVPIQNFTKTSDINWDNSIQDIDKQLYLKYGLADDEIDFIESNVKEMI